LTPAQIWALPFAEWVLFAAGADAWMAKQQEIERATSGG
jgi:hypothetical protein